MRVLNFSEARNKLKSILDQATDDAVAMSLDTFNSILKTFYRRRKGGYLFDYGLADH